LSRRYCFYLSLEIIIVTGEGRYINVVGFVVSIVLHLFAEFTTSHRLGERFEILNNRFFVIWDRASESFTQLSLISEFFIFH
jgi:hypothetical protein